MRIQAIDVGGSTVKAGLFEAEHGNVIPIGETRLLGTPEWPRFEQWLAERLEIGDELLAVACAGHVDPDTGVNHLCAIAGWREYPLRDRLRGAFPRAAGIHVLNDVESHLFAHAHDARHPLMTLAIGSSMGLAFTDSSGRVLRTDPTRPLEYGTIALATSASCREAWWALATPGLEEEQRRRGEREGAERFGYRVGAFCAQHAAAFHVRTVMLSGGMVAHNWALMKDAVRGEFLSGLPEWRREDPPSLHASPHGRTAGLVGIARYAAHRQAR